MMKAKTKKYLTYVVLAILFIIIFVGFSMIAIFRDMKNTMHEMSMDNTTFSNKSYNGYDIDFGQFKNLHFKDAFYSKRRDPVEEYIYNNYYVFLYRLPVVSNKSLNVILNTKFVRTSQMSNVNYYELLDDVTVEQPCNYNILYKVGKPKSGQSINFTLYGENIKILEKTDSLYCYYASLGNFSLNYNKNDTTDFLGKLKSNAKITPLSLPMQIIFRKKNNNFYLFLIIENEHNLSDNNLLKNEVSIR